MRLLAISDLHVGYPENRRFLEGLSAHPDDWLILGGDLGESVDDLEYVLEIATARFAKVLWVPGNHELWTMTPDGTRGMARYLELVEACRRFGALTPEDPWPLWPGPGGPRVIALLFLLYDYSFAPPELPPEAAVEWARDQGVVCADEIFLHPDPYASVGAWCHARCAEAQPHLAAAAARAPLVMVNHFPTRRDVAKVPRYPAFTIWCGTTITEDWHLRYRASVVVSGHLHIPSTRHIDGVRFEEVSLGYPQQWRHRAGGIDSFLREILPGR